MAYGYYSSITVANGKCGSGSSSNFPFLFHTTDNRFKTVGNGGHIVNTTTSNGVTVPADFIIGPNNNGSSPYAFEVEFWDGSTGEIVAWSNTPIIFDATSFFEVHGDASVTTFQGNVTGTWNIAFKGVYHVNGSGPSPNDSTSNAKNGTLSGVTAGTGQIDGGGTFAGWIDTGSSFIGGDPRPLTISAWGKTSDATRANQAIFCNNTDSSSPGLYVQVGSGGGTTCQMMLYSSGYDANGDTFTQDTNLHHYTFQWAGNGDITYRRDGASLSTGAVGNLSYSASGSGSSWGAIEALAGSGFSWAGVLDELRISNVIRGADWDIASYNNQSSPGTFYTLGTETAAGGGGTTYNQSVLAQCTPVPSMVRQTAKARLTTNTPVPGITKQTTKFARGSNTPVPILTRSTGKIRLGSNTPVPTLSSIKTKLQSVLASCTPGPSLSRQTTKAFQASNTPVPALVRQTSKSRLVTNTPVPTVSALKVFLRAVQAQCTPNPTLSRQAGKVVLGSNTPAPTLSRQTGKNVRTTSTPVPTVARSITKTLLAACTPVPTLAGIKVVLKSLQAMTTPVPTMVRAIGKSILASVTPVPSLSKSTAKALQATASALASLVTQFTSGGLGPVLEPLVAFTRRFRANYTVTFRAIYTALIRGKNMPSAKPLPEIIAVIQKSTIGLDFGRMPLPDGVILTGTPTVTISVYDGADASPQSRLTSGPQIGTIPIAKGGSGVENAAIKFQFGNAVAGVTYLIVASCLTTDGDVVAGETHIPAVAPE